MNLLILSAGTRNKIVRYFKRAIEGIGTVIAADASLLGPAIYEADRFYIVPEIGDKNYLDKVLDVCDKEKIDAVLSLIDPEVNLLAKNADVFKKHGVKVIGSSYELCELALDKYSMYCWLRDHGYKCPKTWKDKERFILEKADGVMSYPVYIKPDRGSASIGLFKAYSRDVVDTICTNEEGLLIQENIEGTEIGADVYVDIISGEVVSIFTKKKLKMRAGETDKSVSFKNDRLFELITRFVKEAGFKGQVDIDLIERNGEYYILEVNPRFGGGYPHAYECGCDHMKLIVENLKGNINTPSIGNYEEGVYMMKYSEVMIKKIEQQESDR